MPAWITVATVIAIHDEAIEEFGGFQGLLSPGLLASALDRPRNLLEYEPLSSIFDLAAVLCQGIARNHAFNDGNKRTALLATIAFLDLNGLECEPAQAEEVGIMVAIGTGEMELSAIAAWLANYSRSLRP